MLLDSGKSSRSGRGAGGEVTETWEASLFCFPCSCHLCTLAEQDTITSLAPLQKIGMADLSQEEPKHGFHLVQHGFQLWAQKSF